MSSSKQIARLALPLLAATVLPSSALRHDLNASTQPERTRHLFVAGTMGTGLEFWQAIFKECVFHEVCETREPGFYTSLLYQTDNEDSLKKIWGHHRPKSGRLVPMNLLSPNIDRIKDDYFIHPYSGDVVKGNADPDLNLYAKVAEHWGDSFKVIVLTRGDERDLLQYVMRTRHLSAEEAEKEEAANILKLASQVAQLPRGSYRCQRYEDVLLYRTHIHPMLNKPAGEGQDEVEESQRAMDGVSYGCKSKHHKVPFTRCPKAAPKLRAALDELERHCHPSDVGSRGVALSALREQEAAYASKVQWMLE